MNPNLINNKVLLIKNEPKKKELSLVKKGQRTTVIGFNIHMKQSINSRVLLIMHLVHGAPHILHSNAIST